MVYITGDIHADRGRLRGRGISQLKKGDTLIICGDFGFLWDDSPKEKKLLASLGKRKYNVCFVDGTHENYELLNKCRKTVWKGGYVHRVSGNLLHLMRGQVFTIDGYKIFTFGGGESNDREMRNEGTSWWEREFPSEREMTEGAEVLDNNDCVVDYIVTHEPPSLVKSSLQLRNGETDNINKLNGYFEKINEQCKFKHWYFGSMHEDRTVTVKYTAVFEDVLPIDYYETGI